MRLILTPLVLVSLASQLQAQAPAVVTVALGWGTAYAIATDEDGLQKLERYRVR